MKLLKIIPRLLHCLRALHNWTAFVIFVGVFIMIIIKINGESIEFVQYKDSCYYVSESGLVYSTRTSKPKLLKGHKKEGYLKFALFIGNEKLVIGHHRLLAECFIPNPNNYPLVRHLNDIKSDVRICNLAWGTKSDNANDAVKNGLFINRPSPKGEKNTKAKLTSDQVAAIRKEIASGVHYSKIVEKYGISESYVYKIKLGNTWKHI